MFSRFTNWASDDGFLFSVYCHSGCRILYTKVRNLSASQTHLTLPAEGITIKAPTHKLGADNASHYHLTRLADAATRHTQIYSHKHPPDKYMCPRITPQRSTSHNSTYTNSNCYNMHCTRVEEFLRQRPFSNRSSSVSVLWIVTGPRVCGC